MSRPPSLHGSNAANEDDEQRDGHLLAALRHAPDRTAEPPAAVSQTILSAAHAAARKSQHPHVAPPSSSASMAAALHRRWADAMRRIWSSLGAPRPLWAGASAVLLVSVVTVRMWVDEPLPAAVVSAAPAAEHLPAPAPQAAPRSDSAVARAPNPAAPMAAPMAAPSRSPAVTATTRTPKSPPEPTRQPPLSQAPAPAPAPTPTPTPTSTPTPTQPAPPSRSPVPVPVPEPSLATAPPGASAEAPPAPSPVRSEIARAAGAQPGAGALAARSAAAPAQKTALPVRPPSLSAWLNAARDEVDDPARPLTSPQRRLLRQLDRATVASRWQQLTPTSASGLDRAARDLALRDADGATATLRLDATGLHWLDADGHHWFTALDAATRQSLRQDW